WWLVFVILVRGISSPSLNFYSPLTRGWELGPGTLLAMWQTGRPGTRDRASWKSAAAGVIGLLLIAVPIFCYLPQTRFPGYEAIPPVLGVVLIIASHSRVNQILGVAPLVAVGLIFYSLFFWLLPLVS